MVTVGRIYTNRADTEHYELVFDKLQSTVKTITGYPPRFKRLTEGGNLLSLGLDLEGAQVLGAGASFMKANVPEYSQIFTSDPRVLVTYFAKACHGHGKRFVEYMLRSSGLSFAEALYIERYWTSGDLSAVTICSG